MSDTGWLIALVVVFGVLWLGIKSRNTDAPLQTATSTAGISETAPLSEDTENKAQWVPVKSNVISEGVIEGVVQNPDLSPLNGKLTIASMRQNSAPEREYVLIRASRDNTESIKLTGLSIRSAVSLQSYTIGRGWTLFFPGSAGAGDTVFLKPGDAAYLVSGHPPIGALSAASGGGFQLNVCTGYFEQGLDFYPSLPTSCPLPTEDPLPLPPNTLSDACYDYLARLGRCTTPSEIPQELQTDGSCQVHLTNKINYNQCVSYHKNSPDFYSGEWRLYLGRSTGLWRGRREVIELRDEAGLLIDAHSY